ncbi:DUF3500 domain-containing protein [Flavobacteriaceae bacterium]|nr:DUF3500 domain-containing protein [Flavobacteriaceae bacterium]
MTESQQSIFMELLNVYIDNYAFGFAEDFHQNIKVAGIENLSFACTGSLKAGEGYYYRIQGSMLLIDYHNIQNDANHVHSVCRDLTNDWANILRQHYQKVHY